VVFRFLRAETQSVQVANHTKREARNRMSILWIILIVILVLALLGFFSRGRW
jgi:flagellar basal body-associated protein FliL